MELNRTRFPRRALVGALAMLALGASSCGLDLTDDGPRSQIAAIRGAVAEGLGTNAPAVCEERFTPNALSQWLNVSTGGAVDRCLDTIVDTLPATRVEFEQATDINLAARKAELVAMPIGGENDGTKITVEMDGRGGRWRIGAFTEMEIYDSDRWAAGHIAALQAGGTPARLARCMVKRILAVSSLENIASTWILEGRRVAAGQINEDIVAFCEQR